MNYTRAIPIEDIDQRIEDLRAMLHTAIRSSKVPIAQNPQVLALSRSLDALMNQAQTAAEKEKP